MESQRRGPDGRLPPLDDSHSQVGRAAARADELSRQSTSEPERSMKILSAALVDYRMAFEELQTAEEELREQSLELARMAEGAEAERRVFQDLFDYAPDGYFVTDQDSVIKEANFAAGALLGVEPRFLVGKLLISFVSPADRRQGRGLLAGLARQGQAGRWDARLTPRDGEPFDASNSVAAKTEQRRVREVRWLVRDVTDRRRAEDAIRHANQELEARVAARTAELEAANRVKERLLQAERASRQEAEEARDKAASLADRLEGLLETVSHDLRSPLSSVLGSAQLIDRSPQRTDSVRRLAWQVTSGARHMERILRDVVDSLRVDAGQLVVRWQEVDLASVVSEHVGRQQVEAARVKAEPSLPRVVTDPHLVSRVLDNLIGNALKYSHSGSEVLVRVGREGDRAILAVVDHGRSIDEDSYSHLFERYFRSPDARLGTEGFGLGLFITKGMVEALGGTIAVESEVGSGSTFTVALPLTPPASRSRKA